MKLTVEHLSFSYRKTPVLQNISFELEQGHALCVLGPNGVGKSTLFRCVLGLQSGCQGRILLDGDSVEHLAPRELARRMAYIPQFSAPVFRYSVLDTVLMGTTSQLGALSSPGEAQQRAALDALDHLGIAHLKDRTVGTLSGGERQLVLIARALAQNAPLLVMDEPTASLDLGNAIHVMEMVDALAREGYGIMLSTHDPNQALRYGTHALVLGEGTVQSFGPPESAITAEVLSRVYGLPMTIASVPTGGAPLRICIPADPPSHF